MSKERRPPAAWFLQKRGLCDLAAEAEKNLEIRAQEIQLRNRVLAVANAASKNRACIALVEQTLQGSWSFGCRLAWGRSHLEQLRMQARQLDAELAELHMRLKETRGEARQSELRMQALHARNDVLDGILDEQARQQRTAREDAILEEIQEDFGAHPKRDL